MFIVFDYISVDSKIVKCRVKQKKKPQYSDLCSEKSKNGNKCNFGGTRIQLWKKIQFKSWKSLTHFYPSLVSSLIIHYKHQAHLCLSLRLAWRIWSQSFSRSTLFLNRSSWKTLLLNSPTTLVNGSSGYHLHFLLLASMPCCLFIFNSSSIMMNCFLCSWKRERTSLRSNIQVQGIMGLHQIHI